MKEALYLIGDLVHDLQMERGCTTAFLGSYGKIFKSNLTSQYKKTDTALKSLAEAVQRWVKQKSLKETLSHRAEELLHKCQELTELRNITLSQKIPQHEAIDFYTHTLIGPLLQIMVETTLYMKDASPNKASAFSAFMQWKERVGLERALGTRGFISYGFQNKEFLERILFLLSEQKNYQRTFFVLSDDTFKNIGYEALNDGIFKRIDDLHDTLKSETGKSELSHLTPESWFELISKKIDLLYKCEKKLIDNLVLKGEAIDRVAETTLKSDENITPQLELIKSFRLFSGLSNDNINKLLKHGQIRDFPKGKLLFLEGEQANRLYIVIKGWVKVFKGTAAGEETILQMLSCGDSIMEAAVFLNSTFPISAQIIEDATLISLPAPMIREQLRTNNELAQNLLASMAYRSQNLIRQIENARLKSADQRVGWFLLKLLLEQGRTSIAVELPYDKSMVASYLDMKRETFSRALKRLKERGFKIENDTIVIPKLSSLCGYCDHDLAGECKLHGTAECPNPQVTETDENAA